MANRQDWGGALMEIANMMAMYNQQRQQTQMQQFGMQQQQQQMQMQQQRIAEEKRRWEMGAPLRKSQAEAAKLQIDALKHEADVTKQKEEIGTLVSEYMAQEGIGKFTSPEQAFETIPGLKEYGAQIGYIGDVLQPFMQEAITPVELLQWGAPYESFVKAHPQYAEVVTPEAWNQRIADIGRIKELEIENPTLANELLGLQVEQARKDFENYDKILAAKLRGPAGPAPRQISPYEKLAFGGSLTDTEWGQIGVDPTNEEQKALVAQRAATVYQTELFGGGGIQQAQPQAEGGINWEGFMSDFNKAYDPASIGEQMGLVKDAEGTIRNMLERAGDDYKKAIDENAPAWVYDQMWTVINELQTRLDNLEGV